MTNDSDEGDREAVVLDFLAHGESGGGYDQSPLAYAVGAADFTLYEATLAQDADVTIGDRIDVYGDEAGVNRIRAVEYEDLSGGAQSELDYVVEEIVEANEDRFVDFFNDAQPITLRLHQLNLLPGIGKKLRNAILDERKREPFASFEDLEDRVGGLHDPKGVIVDRILEELQKDDLKYRNFVGDE